MPDDPDSTMNFGAMSVKIKYNANNIRENSASIRALERFQASQEGLNRSFGKHKDEMEQLKIDNRLEALESWRETQKHSRNQALEIKQSNKGIWIPTIASILMFLYVIIKEAFGG